MYRVFLGLGGNIGNLPVNFQKVKKRIDEECGKIIATSSIYMTPPMGFESNDFFWNQVVEIESLLQPEEILFKIRAIEKELGRMHVQGEYTSRPMDIDILYFDDKIIKTENLKVPHPRIPERKFVLVPLVELAPDFKHPFFGLTNFQLLGKCSDRSVIEKIDDNLIP
jgi:2-amino-4-hydroxy-6-hydroxymethyldihydropteridine diphosphokinase